MNADRWTTTDDIDATFYSAVFGSGTARPRGIVAAIPPRGCYIDDCRSPARYILHSYPDDVQLCGDHKSLHPIEPGETRCTGPGCVHCDDDL